MILKDFLTQTNGLVVLAEKGIPLTHGSSHKHSSDSYECMKLTLLHSKSHFFPNISPPFSLCSFSCYIFTQ